LFAGDALNIVLGIVMTLYSLFYFPLAIFCILAMTDSLESSVTITPKKKNKPKNKIPGYPQYYLCGIWGVTIIAFVWLGLLAATLLLKLTAVRLALPWY
jgi:hypothetical protein